MEAISEKNRVISSQEIMPKAGLEPAMTVVVTASTEGIEAK
jgi:hypothetical protein